MNKKIIDVLIFMIIGCAFISGYWMGEKKQIDKDWEFYNEYIDNNCQCKKVLERSNNKISYEVDYLPLPSFGWQDDVNTSTIE